MSACKSALDSIEGLTEVDPALLEEFERKMTDEVIPEIVAVLEERQILAAKHRLLPLRVL